MNISVKKISPSTKSDFYKIHCKENGYEWCNCVAWWCPTWDEFKNRTETQNREQRESLFSQGEYDGYVLYDNNEPIGWSQVGKRDRLSKLCQQYDLILSPDTYAITCFNIIPKYRRKGLVHRFMSEIITDLKASGVKHVQGFPKKKTEDPWTGPESAFKKAGFKIERDGDSPVYSLEIT